MEDGSVAGVGAGLLLLIDTSGTEGSVALADGLTVGREIGEANVAAQVIGLRRMAGRSSSERLLPEVRGLLAEAGCGLSEVAAIAVVLGPGSFTGVRIGVATAKGLAESLAVPVIGLSRLAVMARMARDSGTVGEAVALIDAGRGEVFAGRYGADGAMVREGLLTAEAARVMCEGLPVVAFEPGVVEAMRPTAVELVGCPDAGSAMELAVERLGAGEFADVTTMDAHYLRSTAAEIVARAGRGGERRGVR